MVLIDGIPVHPLIVHAVVVLLPLAALGAVAVAVRPAWRRSLGVPVLLIALAGVVAVPIATWAGEQLQAALPGPNPAIEEHAQRGDVLLPFAVAFLVLLAAAVIVGHRGDREAAGSGGTVTATRTGLGTALGVPAALAGLVVAGLVVWIGHAGATAVWQGVGQ
jgi:hypothetical protein